MIVFSGIVCSGHEIASKLASLMTQKSLFTATHAFFFISYSFPSFYIWMMICDSIAWNHFWEIEHGTLTCIYMIFALQDIFMSIYPCEIYAAFPLCLHDDFVTWCLHVTLSHRFIFDKPGFGNWMVLGVKRVHSDTHLFKDYDADQCVSSTLWRLVFSTLGILWYTPPQHWKNIMFVLHVWWQVTLTCHLTVVAFLWIPVCF